MSVSVPEMIISLSPIIISLTETIISLIELTIGATVMIVSESSTGVDEREIIVNETELTALVWSFVFRVMPRYRALFIDKLTPAFSAFRCVGAVDAVSEFRYGHHGDNDWRIADFGSGTILRRTSGVVSLARSAATRTLESRTNPRMDSIVPSRFGCFP